MSKKFMRNTNPKFWNEPRSYCNCGSFALDVAETVLPYDNDLDYTEEERDYAIEDMLDTGMSREEVMEVIAERDFDAILKYCDWLEPIELEDARPEDRVVAYRIFITFDEDRWSIEDQDFHFRVRINGFWFEKNGGGPVRCCNDEDQLAPWVCAGGELVYDSVIKYGRFRNLINS